jgi:hypothetical protein
VIECVHGSERVAISCARPRRDTATRSGR